TGSTALAQTITTSRSALPAQRQAPPALSARRWLAIGIGLAVPCAGLMVAMLLLAHRQDPLTTAPEPGRADRPAAARALPAAPTAPAPAAAAPASVAGLASPSASASPGDRADA